MTREEAIEIIQKLIGRFKSDSRTYKALEMAIQALSQEPTNTWSIKDVADTFKKHGLIREQEPCDDAISRKKAIYVISARDGKSAQIEALEQLPSVITKPESVTEFADRCRECGAKYGKLLEQIRAEIENEADEYDAYVNADVARGLYKAGEIIDKHMN